MKNLPLNRFIRNTPIQRLDIQNTNSGSGNSDLTETQIIVLIDSKLEQLKPKIHYQSVPLTVWTINHDFNYRPTVSITDSAGSEVFGNVDHPTSTQVVITFSAAFSGEAVLS